jgi:FKBP-type peptidyl-prolyl cis-trans isomerase SlyD
MTQITEDSVVTLSYELRVSDENGDTTLVETAEAEEPMLFLMGRSGLPEKFESALLGKQAGDAFEVTLAPEEGYGEYDEDMLVTLPRDTFSVDGQIDGEMLQVGNYLPMADQEGNHMQGRVDALDGDAVRMDFNHPLAGMTMHFRGRVESTRPATAEEIDHGHIHGPGGHQH